MGRGSPTQAPRLILFDIDGTLLLGNRRLRSWFGEALTEVFGRAGAIDGHSFAGKIDPQIVTELISDTGIPHDRIEEGIVRVRDAYLARLERSLVINDLRLLPHVRELLDRLAARGEVHLGLLTGNWEAVARTKLRLVDLDRYFPFGAFSDGQRLRRDLPPLALERVRLQTGERLEATETLIVGDSVLDIDCAHHHDIRVIAVATGYTSRSDLESAGADWVLGTLAEIDRVHPVFRR